MSAVSVSTLQPLFQRFDADRNGKMDRAEIAQASLNLLQSGDAVQINQGNLFATFVQGGVNKNGLLPDMDKDNALSLAELSNLASHSGDGAAIEASDFQKGFGNAFVAGGNTVDMAKLKELAATKPVTGGPDPLPPQPQINNFFQLMLQMMTLMLGLFRR